jgi:hypothetical protein
MRILKSITKNAQTLKDRFTNVKARLIKLSHVLDMVSPPQSVKSEGSSSKSCKLPTVKLATFNGVHVSKSNCHE